MTQVLAVDHDQVDGLLDVRGVAGLRLLPCPGCVGFIDNGTCTI